MYRGIFGWLLFVSVVGLSLGIEDIIDLQCNDEDIQLILGIHNDLRQRVASGDEKRGSPGPQPKAAYMPDLVWDEDLANTAWKWAQNCQYGHDPNLRGMQMGQNIAITYKSQQTFTPDWAHAALCPWASEVENVDCRFVENFRGLKAPNRGDIGHYTQMVWAETTAIGCAAIGYTDYSLPRMPYRIFYVCNYSPPGNYIGQRVYEADYSSSYCPL